MRTNKGQGALEYLLLIGGAVLVAAIVIVLLLNLGTSNTGTSEAQFIATSAAQIATQQGTNSCTDLVSGSVDSAYVWYTKSNSCYLMSGTFANCMATKQTTVTQSINCCSVPGSPPDCTSTAPASEKRYTQIGPVNPQI